LLLSVRFGGFWWRLFAPLDFFDRFFVVKQSPATNEDPCAGVDLFVSRVGVCWRKWAAMELGFYVADDTHSNLPAAAS